MDRWSTVQLRTLSVVYRDLCHKVAILELAETAWTESNVLDLPISIFDFRPGGISVPTHCTMHTISW